MLAHGSTFDVHIPLFSLYDVFNLWQFVFIDVTYQNAVNCKY